MFTPNFLLKQNMDIYLGMGGPHPKNYFVKKFVFEVHGQFLGGKAPLGSRELKRKVRVPKVLLKQCMYCLLEHVEF